DDVDDADLVVDELRHGGFDPQFERVDDGSSLGRALDHGTWDVVLCDYYVPAIEASEMLETVHRHDPNLPCMIVAGAVTDEAAAAAMRAGARDYIQKSNLRRLVPAVERELKEAALRVDRARAREALQRVEQSFEAVIDRLPDGVLVERRGRVVYANPA